MPVGGVGAMLYREWFVRLRFPAPAYKHRDGIRGWEHEKIGNLLAKIEIKRESRRKAISRKAGVVCGPIHYDFIGGFTDDEMRFIQSTR